MAPPATAVVVSVLLAVGLAAASAVRAEGEPLVLDDRDWPCKQKYVARMSVAQFWNGPPIDGLGADWHQDREVRALVERLASPETDAETAVGAIEGFARTLAGDTRRTERLAGLFSGLIEEMNVYRDFAIEGVLRFAVRRRLMADRLADTEARTMALPHDGTAASEAERTRLETRLFWERRAFDDAADEARFLCHRMTAIEAKTGRLVRAVLSHLAP